jgi:ribonuclease P protein component
MKVHGLFFDIYLSSPKNNGKPKFFVVVSPNVSKKAVERNLVKRRIRAILRGLSSIPYGKVTIVSKPGSVGARFAELKHEISSALSEP